MLAAEELTRVTPERSTTRSRWPSPMRSRAAPTAETAPKNIAPVTRKTTACGIGALLVVGRARAFLDRDRLRHPVDEEHGAEREADDDRLGQVAEEREAEGHEEDGRVAPGGAQRACEGGLLDHVPGDEGEDGGEGGEWDVGGERRRDEDEDSRKSECAMPATGPWAPARTFVAVRAMVPVTQKPPKRPGGDVGDALGDELGVRAVAPAGHAVGDDGGEERLDRAEEREAEGGRQHRPHLRPVHRRQVRRG